MTFLIEYNPDRLVFMEKAAFKNIMCHYLLSYLIAIFHVLEFNSFQ